MSSKHLVDPELVHLIDVMPRVKLTNEESLKTARENLIKMFQSFKPTTPEGIIVTERMIPGAANAPDVKILIYKTKKATDSEPLPVLIDIHSGGYVMSNAELNSPMCANFADALGCVVVGVEYRLAPETPFPGAIDDAYSALKFVYTNAAELGINPKQIGLHGQSAGGGLVAALSILARDRAEVPILFQHLLYPMLDDRTGSTVSANPLAGEFVWTPESNHFGWSSYLGKSLKPGSPNVSPYAAANRSTDLSNLPPTFIGCGSIDLLCEESIDYARRLILAGVPTELHIYPGAFHGFPRAAAAAQVSKAYHSETLASMKRHFKIK